MAGRIVPETANRPDWPRLVAQGHKDHESRIKDADSRLSALEAMLTLANLHDYADDTAAAAGGVAVGEFYRTGSAIMVRVS